MLKNLTIISLSLGSLLLAGCQSVQGLNKPFSDDVMRQDASMAKAEVNAAPQSNYVTPNNYTRAVVVESPTPTKAVEKVNTQPKPYIESTNKPSPQPVLNQEPPKEKKKLLPPLKIKNPFKANEPNTNVVPYNTYVQQTTIDPSVYAAASEPNMPKTNGYSYLLGSGDKVRIIVFGEDSLSGEFYVNGEGNMSLPLIGEVKASGKTVTELQRAVEAELADGYLKNPKVSAEVLNFRPFYILGEVQKPGMYAYSSGLTVDSAVALGGGYTYRADKRKYFVKHESQNFEIEIPAGGAILVQPGDTIRVSERYF